MRIGLTTRNPADAVDAPKRDTSSPQLMDEAGAHRLLVGFEDTDIGMLVWLALHTGARLGELLALRRADIDLTQSVIHINRTVVERNTPLETASALCRRPSEARQLPAWTII